MSVKLAKNSLGNTNRFRSWEDDKRNPDRKINRRIKQENSISIVNDVLCISDCCARGDAEGNHILNHFKNDFNSAIEFVESCRDKSASKRFKNKENLCQFIASEYKKCRTGTITVTNNGGKKDVVDWQINGVKLCRKLFMASYGISKFFLDHVVSLLKENGDDVSFESFKPYKDSDAPKMTFLEAKAKFEENFIDPRKSVFHLPQFSSMT